MSLEDFQPIWPETVVFWGAGATAALRMRTTQQQQMAIYDLAAPKKKLMERVKQVFPASKYQQDIADLLKILGDPCETISEEEACRRQFSGWRMEKIEKRVHYLRSSYNWGVLRDLIHICPGKSRETFRLQDLFNLIDMHVYLGQGFYVHNGQNHESANHEPRFVPPETLIPARNALKMLITLMFFVDYQDLIHGESRSVMDQYNQFTDILYQLMIDEGIEFYNHQKIPMQDRKFYLFSYALISMNWDPLLLWFLFNSHRKGNNAKSVVHLGDPPHPLKMFHDMGHFMGVRQVDGESPDVWFPFNETVVQRINDPEHVTSRRVRVGKFYFPHGCIGWRECPNCGKLMMYLGNDWKIDSPSLFPPPLLPSLSKGCVKPRSQKEKTAHDQGKTDVLQCPFCGTLTELRHTPLIMQSNFKGNNPSFVEEIQKDMRVALEKARHIVIMGYSLPPDDVIYRSLLAARQNRNSDERTFCSIVVGRKDDAPDHWLNGQELDHFLKQHKDDPFVETVQTARDLFGEDRVRGYFRGIPQVFLGSSGMASKEKVVELLYPKKYFPHYPIRGV